MRIPGAQTNTHGETIEGRIILNDGIIRARLTVRFTSDQFGETISIGDDNAGILMLVPFEKVEKLIEETRKEAER